MISFKVQDAKDASEPAFSSRRLAGLVLLCFLSSCANDPFHQLGLKQAKEGPVEEGIAKLKESSDKNPGNPPYRVDYLRERERVINQSLLDAARLLGKGELNEAETIYQRVLSIDPDNAQARLGASEVVRARQHEDALATARDAMERAEYDAARAALQPVLLENPRHAAALELNRQIETARFTNGISNQIPELGSAYKKPVSLQFRDANLKMIFEAISKTSGLNILMDKEIKSDLKATIFVKQASVEDTINLLLMQNQLEKKVLNENTLYIYPATAAKLKEHQDLVVRTFQLTNADAKQMQTMLKTVLKAKDLFINEKTNSIIMRDTPEVVTLAAKLLAAQDMNEPEVMLEVEVMEISQSLLTELGLAYPSQVSFTIDDTIKTLRDWDKITHAKVNVTTGLGVTLNAKKTNGELNILANPRIRVRQHEKAKIHIGQRYPVITNTVTPSTGTPVVSETIQYVDLGLKLEVEPDIHLDGEVGIKTSLEISDLGKETFSGTGDKKSSAYSFLTRTASTVLRLKDGETQILGGLIDSKDNNDAVKVPGLGDIPLLGRLFSSHKHTNDKTELILAITPHIIRNIRQPDADLSSYWSGTEGTVRSRPLTVEKMDSMKVESSGGSVPVQGVASESDAAIKAATGLDVKPAASQPASPAVVVKPANAVQPAPQQTPAASSAAPSTAPTATVPVPAAPGTGAVAPGAVMPAPSIPIPPSGNVYGPVPRGVPVPRPAAPGAGSAGMSDAVVR